VKKIEEVIADLRRRAEVYAADYNVKYNPADEQTGAQRQLEDLTAQHAAALRDMKGRLSTGFAIWQGTSGIRRSN